MKYFEVTTYICLRIHIAHNIGCIALVCKEDNAQCQNDIVARFILTGGECWKRQPSVYSTPNWDLFGLPRDNDFLPLVDMIMYSEAGIKWY